MKRWHLILIVALLFLLAWVVSGCSCNYHLRKAARKCGKTVIKDTVIVHDTLKVPEIKTDTLFKSSIGDTVYIDKDRLHIKYVRLPGDSVFYSWEM